MRQRRRPACASAPAGPGSCQCASTSQVRWLAPRHSAPSGAPALAAGWPGPARSAPPSTCRPSRSHARSGAQAASPCQPRRPARCSQTNRLASRTARVPPHQGKPLAHHDKGRGPGCRSRGPGASGHAHRPPRVARPGHPIPNRPCGAGRQCPGKQRGSNGVRSWAGTGAVDNEQSY